MTVNNISGLTQYINPQNTETANSQNPIAKQQTHEPSTADLNSAASDPSKQAFTINITTKAKETFAANNTDNNAPVANESKLPANNNGKQQAEQLINLVA